MISIIVKVSTEGSSGRASDLSGRTVCRVAWLTSETDRIGHEIVALLLYIMLHR